MIRTFALTFGIGLALFALFAWWASYHPVPDVGGWRLLG